MSAPADQATLARHTLGATGQMDSVPSRMAELGVKLWMSANKACVVGKDQLPHNVPLRGNWPEYSTSSEPSRVLHEARHWTQSGSQVS